MNKYAKMWIALKITLKDMQKKMPEAADEMKLFESIMNDIENYVDSLPKEEEKC